MTSLAQGALRLICESNINADVEKMSCSEILEFAQRKGRLPELHKAYQSIAPIGTKLRNTIILRTSKLLLRKMLKKMQQLT
jgi:hypothetical protein